MHILQSTLPQFRQVFLRKKTMMQQQQTSIPFLRSSMGALGGKRGHHSLPQMEGAVRQCAAASSSPSRL